MYVLTIDQRNSQLGSDRVPELLEILAPVPAVLGFERTVGDELQGVLSDPSAAVDAAMRALRCGDWYVGIGVGPVDEPLGPSPRESAGAAFVAARRAVDRAKKTGDRVPLAVAGSDGAPDAEAVLVLIGRLVMARTDAEWRILDALGPLTWGAQSALARKLGISSQAVSGAVLRSGWQEEWAARPAAAFLLDRADQSA